MCLYSWNCVDSKSVCSICMCVSLCDRDSLASYGCLSVCLCLFGSLRHWSAVWLSIWPHTEAHAYIHPYILAGIGWMAQSRSGEPLLRWACLLLHVCVLLSLFVDCLSGPACVCVAVYCCTATPDTATESSISVWIILNLVLLIVVISTIQCLRFFSLFSNTAWYSCRRLCGCKRLKWKHMDWDR